MVKYGTSLANRRLTELSEVIIINFSVAMKHSGMHNLGPGVVWSGSYDIPWKTETTADNNTDSDYQINHALKTAILYTFLCIIYSASLHHGR